MRHGTAFYVTNAAGEVLVRRRPPKGLLGGMVELPGTPWVPVAVEPNSDAVAIAGRVTHTFTHFKLFLDVVATKSERIVAAEEREACWWLDPPSLDREALPTLMRNAVALARRSAQITRPVPSPESRRHHRN